MTERLTVKRKVTATWFNFHEDLFSRFYVSKYITAVSTECMVDTTCQKLPWQLQALLQSEREESRHSDIDTLLMTLPPDTHTHTHRTCLSILTTGNIIHNTPVVHTDNR